MQATRTSSQTMSEPLTWAEICVRYPDEWVCLVEVEIDRFVVEDSAIRTARVVGHGKIRQEAVEQAQPWSERYAEIAQEFTGPILVLPDPSPWFMDSDAPCARLQRCETVKDPRPILVRNP